MQFNLFILGTTFLFILSQFGYVTDACMPANCCPCEDGWARVKQYCLKVFPLGKNALIEEVKAICARNNASTLIPDAEGPKGDFYRMMKAEIYTDHWRRLVCARTLDNKIAYDIRNYY